MPLRVGWLQREDGPPPHFVLYDEDAQLHRPRQARDARARPRAAVVPAGAGQGEAADPAIASGSCRPTSPSSTHRDGRYIVHRRRASRRSTSGPTPSTSGAKVHRPAPQPGARRAGPQRARAACSSRWASTPSRRCRFDERIAVPRATCCEGTAPQPPRAGASAIERGPPGGALRRAARRDRRRRARARPACACTSRARTARTPAGSTSPASSPAPASTSPCSTLPLLRRLIEHYELPVEDGRIKLQTNCGVPGLDQPGLAPVRDGPDRQQRDPARRHDRRAEVHRPALRRRLRARRAPARAAVPRPPGRCSSRCAGRDRQRIRAACAARSSWPEPCARPSSAASQTRTVDPHRAGDPRPRSSRSSPATRAGSS